MEDKMVLKEKKDTLIVYFKGEVDHQNTLHYREKLICCIQNGCYKEVIMDFRDVTFIDSSGIGLVLGRYNQIRNKGGILYFAHLSSVTKRLFELSGLLKLIETRKEEERE